MGEPCTKRCQWMQKLKTGKRYKNRADGKKSIKEAKVCIGLQCHRRTRARRRGRKQENEEEEQEEGREQKQVKEDEERQQQREEQEQEK